MTNPKDYDVGYKKTPTHSRFKQGQSGNPKGRPKKKSISFEILEELNRKVKVRENGIEQKMSKRAALAKSLLAAALSGNIQALKEVRTAVPTEFQVPPPKAEDTLPAPSDVEALNDVIEYLKNDVDGLPAPTTKTPTEVIENDQTNE